MGVHPTMCRAINTHGRSSENDLVGGGIVAHADHFVTPCRISQAADEKFGGGIHCDFVSSHNAIRVTKGLAEPVRNSGFMRLGVLVHSRSLLKIMVVIFSS